MIDLLKKGVKLKTSKKCIALRESLRTTSTSICRVEEWLDHGVVNFVNEERVVEVLGNKSDLQEMRSMRCRWIDSTVTASPARCRTKNFIGRVTHPSLTESGLNEMVQ